MPALRKKRDGAAPKTPAPPPEALAYDADVTAQAVAHMQRKADRELEGEEWAIVDGDVGDKR
ncbi:hypothetical protein CCR97_23745 [Rhodoplanes elegans]|uniref:Uncharacterized protein n=1 Tax=Rhodoplanes elegans TaxID=29408 RepID=A0A327JWQ6_9BRAD|nr:hypothetical protein [Rhodoplanes elegans]MBK5961194.1 hypothetical protein [Rhodoplanes elegans]RAI30950.1 hypothetical protein CH338_26735 [Rhodoplanes elegans]